MAWVDDRLWCHPKLVTVSDKAFRVWVGAVCYSAGFQLHGRLEDAHQRAVGGTPKVRDELVRCGLWEDAGDGAIVVHDWDEHNGRRDRERAQNRERKRRQRQRDNTVTSGVTSGVTSTVTAHCEGSEGSEEDQDLLFVGPNGSVGRGEQHEPAFDGGQVGVVVARSLEAAR